MTDNILSIQDLSVSFRGSFVQAVEHVSMDIRANEHVCIIGETGSGKSILLLAILRLLGKNADVSGKAFYRGRELTAMTQKQLDKIRGDRISYVPQGSGNGMNPLLRVGLQVGEPLMAHRRLPRPEAEHRAVELLKRFHLGREEELARQYPFTFSGGMRQRALIAMGVSADAELLFADEPTKGLDEKRVDIVADTLNGLTDRTILCVTHDLGFARKVATRISVMYAANQLEIAPADKLFADPLHPYTRDMINAMPENGLQFNPGFAPAHDDTSRACKYYERCAKRHERCKEMPPMVSMGDREVRCWLYVD